MLLEVHLSNFISNLRWQLLQLPFLELGIDACLLLNVSPDLDLQEAFFIVLARRMRYLPSASNLVLGLLDYV